MASVHGVFVDLSTFDRMSLHWTAATRKQRRCLVRQSWYIHGRSVPRSIEILRTITWIIALAVLVPWQGLIKDQQRSKPLLPTASLERAEAFIASTLHAQERGSAYTAADYAFDAGRIAVVRDRLNGFVVSSTDRNRVEQSAHAAMDQLYHLASNNLMSEFAAQYPDHVKKGKGLEIGYAQTSISNAVNKLYHVSRDFHPDFYPSLPEPNVKFSLPGAARRFGMAWLWSLIPAFVGIVLRCRAARRSLLEELLLRPWAPVLATVFWWYGLSCYPEGFGAVELRFERLKWRFRQAQGRDPNERETAELLREASGPVLSFEAALARVKDAPALVQVRSRRAIFAAWVMTTLSAPVQFLSTVGTAWAQVASTTQPAAASVETPRKRPNGRLWGFFQGQMTLDGFRLPHARLKGVHGLDGVTVTFDADCARARLKELAVSVPVGPFTMTAGQILTPTTNDFPPPHKQLFPESPLDEMNPNFNDQGIAVAYARSGSTLQAGALNGEGTQASNDDRCVDGVGRIERTFGHLILAASWQHEFGGPRDYRAGFATFDPKLGRITPLLSVGYAERKDLGRTAAHARTELSVGETRAGIQVERPTGIVASLERWLGGLNRIALTASARRGSAPVWELRFQRVMTFYAQ